MKRLLTDTLPQTMLLNEMLTPLKRCHQPNITTALLNSNLTCYQNILKEKDGDFNTVNGVANDIFQSEMADDLPPTSSHHMPFKSLHSFKLQDSFIFGRLSAAHRNSFDELGAFNDKCVKQENIESCNAGAYKGGPYR